MKEASHCKAEGRRRQTAARLRTLRFLAYPVQKITTSGNSFVPSEKTAVPSASKAFTAAGTIRTLLHVAAALNKSRVFTPKEFMAVRGL